MVRKMQPELRETWRNRIERQADSGLSVREFCRQEDVSQANFYLWKRKLRASETAPRKRSASRRPVAETKRAGGKAPNDARAVAFMQVPLPCPPGSPWIEVALAEGTIIRIPQQNLTAVQTILRTLAGSGTFEKEAQRYA